MNRFSPEAFYQPFLMTASRRHWEKVGLKKRAGVAVPLFSLYSSKSIGVGELNDLKLLIDWCRRTGMSIIQLLPLNDVGFEFRPYDVQSTFALDPMYLSLENLNPFPESFKDSVSALRVRYPAQGPRVRYEFKAHKLNLLRKIFDEVGGKESDDFSHYIRENKSWLKDYALFKVIKEIQNGKSWEAWDKEFRYRTSSALERIEKIHADDLRFHHWLQWQLFLQLQAVKRSANLKDVLLMGDLPFLVARDSADVWAHQESFRLDFVAGAPPDAYLAKGQRWGMPPYEWKNIEATQYEYFIERLRYAQNFYDLYRIDHVVGIFRTWIIPSLEPVENGGLRGSFDPKDETSWEEHGRHALNQMLEKTEMLPCGEDLGTIPPCTFKVLSELGIPGIDIQRWNRDWEQTFQFKSPDQYRKNSIAMISTHDMSSFRGWWRFEAGTVNQALFQGRCEDHGIPFKEVARRLFDLSRSRHGRLRWKKELQTDKELLQILGKPENEVKDLLKLYHESYGEKEKFWSFLELEGLPNDIETPELIQKAFQKICQSASVFSIQFLHDWLSLDPLFQADALGFRINRPGTIQDENWSIVMPYSLEQMQGMKLNSLIKEIISSSDRV